jgi:hypothetical protein
MTTPVKEPAAKHARVGESPTNIDIDANDITEMNDGQLGESLDETGGLAPRMQPLDAHVLAPPPTTGSEVTVGINSGVQGQVTLEAISKLLDNKFEERLSPVTQSIDKLVVDFGIFKTKMNDEMASMGLKLKELESSDGDLLNMIKKIEQDMKTFKLEHDQDFSKKLVELQSRVLSPDKLTIVLGNVPNATTLEQAQEWLSKRCIDSGVPQPIETYCKSTEFNGVLFAKCLSASHRDQTISAVRRTNGASFPKPWAKIDQPLDIRTGENTLFAFKRMLVDWGYSKGCIFVDREARTLTVAGTKVLEVVVEENVLKMKWCNGEWESWEDLQAAQELADIQQKAQDTLNRAKGSTDKGKGKGPIPPPPPVP